MHFNPQCNISQHHGFHILGAVLKEGLLFFNNAGRYPEQSVVPAFQTFNEPLCFLQIVTDKLTVTFIAGSRTQCGIMAVYPQTGKAV